MVSERKAVMVNLSEPGFPLPLSQNGNPIIDELITTLNTQSS